MAAQTASTPLVYGTNESIGSLLDQSITRHYLTDLKDQNNKICAEYVWIGGTGADLRSKARTLDKKAYKVEVRAACCVLLSLLAAQWHDACKPLGCSASGGPRPAASWLDCPCRRPRRPPLAPQELPHWNYDGSSTGQAPGTDSEVYLVPRAIYKDPFRGGDNILVMCDCYEPPRANKDGTMTEIKAIPTNTRAACAAAMEKAKAHEPWFGIEQVRACARARTRAPGPACVRSHARRTHAALLAAARPSPPRLPRARARSQEYTLLNVVTKWPLGWPKGGYPAPQGPYYCSAGAGVSIGRDIPEVHYR